MQVTEWWVRALDEYGDTIELFYCTSRALAVKERDDRTTEYPCAEWSLERVKRKYSADGTLLDEEATDEEW